MPGNEAADKLYNFFEQESLHQKQPSSQAAGANWSVLSNNPQVREQGNIEATLNSDTKNCNRKFTDSEVHNNQQSSQTLFQTNKSQLPSRNQDLSLNGFINENQSLQNGYNHTEFLRSKDVSDQYKSTSRRPSIIERGNAPEHSSVLARTSERLETIRNPVNFDSLNQQHIMNNLQPRMSQLQPRQQTGVGDMQLWQQQIMFKQLEELQRQKQLQQLQQDGRHQTQLNQLSAFAKQAANSHLPTIVNGMPIDGSGNFAWQNEVPGGNPAAPNSPQMLLIGNPNWAQRGGYSAGIPDGLISNEQAQMFRSMGMVPQQLDQSIYGSHNVNTRGAFNQYSQQGNSQDYASTLNTANVNHSDKPSMQFTNLHGGQSALFSNQASMQDGASVSRQSFQGKSFLGHLPFQGMNSGVQPGNPIHGNSLSGSTPRQEFQGREQQAGWSGSLQERASTHVGSSQGLVSLDPTEKKILFSSDDNIWDVSSGKDATSGEGGYGNLLERGEDLNGFPSIQSGTWSALMQSAVAEASSSEAGLQDEWSGLSFHKREPSNGDQPLAQGDATKPQTDWVDSNLHSSSSASKPFPLFDDGKMSESGQNLPNFQNPATGNIYGQRERIQHGASYDAVQQPLNNSGKWSDSSSQQMHVSEGNHHVQHSMNSAITIQRAWTRQTPSEGPAHATNGPVDAPNMQVPWSQQHGVPTHNTNSQHFSSPTGWNNNNSLSDSREATLPISEIGNCGQGFQRNNLKMGVERDHDGRLMATDSSSNFMDNRGSHLIRREASFVNNGSTSPFLNATMHVQEMNQKVQNGNHINLRKHMVDSPSDHRDDSMGYNQNLVNSPVLEASVHNSERGSGETYDRKRENSFQKEFSNDSYNSSPSQPTVAGGGLRENSWLSTSDSRPTVSANHTTSQVGHKAPVHRRFQYHPMGGMESDLEATDTSKRVTHMQSLAQQSLHAPRGNEREHIGQLGVLNHASNSTSSMGKEQTPDFQRTERGSASSDGSAGTFSQGSRTVQTCQNMLELFHNVDRSVEHNMPSHFRSSDRSASANVPEVEVSDASVIHQWNHQSTASQGFGLRLAPPSERLPFTNHVLNTHNSSQMINNLNSRQSHSNVEERTKRGSAPVSSMQSLPQEVSQREHLNNTANISEQMGSETSKLNVQANLPAAYASSLPYLRHQQSKQMSRINERSMNDRLASNYRQIHGTYDEVANNQLVQVSMPGTTSKTSQVASPSENTSNPETSSGSHTRLSGQQFPILESVPISRPSSVSGRSQQDELLKMHHVLSSMSAQQHLTGRPPNKVPPNLSQFSSPGNGNLERTLFAAQKHGQDTKKGGNHPDFGSFSTNLQSAAYGQENTWKHRQVEKVDRILHKSEESQGPKSPMEHSLGTESISPAPVISHLHQQEVHRGRYGKDPALVCQNENSSRNCSTSTRDIEAFGRSLRQANQNYSLLHQVQAMKGMETDIDKRGGKRYKRTDVDEDSSPVAHREGQQSGNIHNVTAREMLSGGQNVAVQHASFSSRDGKLLSFSSEGRGNQSINTASQMVHGVVSSQDMTTFSQNDSQVPSSGLALPFIRSESPQLNPKMAPTWFDRYGTFRPEQILPMQDAQCTVKPIPQQFLSVKESEGPITSNLKEQVNVVASRIENVCQDLVTTISHGEGLTHLPSGFTGQTLVVRSKKRKVETSMHLPWHKEIMCGSQRLPTISISEQDWAQAANRLVDKMEDEAELADDVQQMIRPRRRLIYSTQLMQQLFCAAPAEILSARATLDYETLLYSVAKLALGQACSLIYSSGSDSYHPVVNESSESEKPKTPKQARDQYFSKVAENFIDRAKKLEIDLSRLDRRVSVLDLRLESQDLERFSVINRFAKFHNRSQADTAENSMSVSHRTFPQRYVTARAVSGNLPEAVHCVSL